jgi:hypothetical protein
LQIAIKLWQYLALTWILEIKLLHSSEAISWNSLPIILFHFSCLIPYPYRGDIALSASALKKAMKPTKTLFSKIILPVPWWNSVSSWHKNISC